MLFCSTQLAFADDTETFIVRVLGDTDTTPPTTPTLLTINAITYSQIDITWSSSTDDTIVAGYVVSRGGAPIATTTLFSYSDTGLSGSTTYSYTVRAFDAALNYSSSSNALATTTPAAPVPPPTVDSDLGQGTVAKTVLDQLQVDTGVSTATLSMTTAMPARVELRWGKTTDYELGYIVSDIFRRDHVIDLADLEPGTRYQFELVGYTARGIQTVLEAGSFTTKVNKVAAPPPNVSYFTAEERGVDVFLSWKLPVMDDFSRVRVVRSHYGFPAHPQDGALVYQGRGANGLDGDILRHYSPVFYTAFVYDENGNVSSGAVAVVYATDDSPSDGSPSGIETDPIQIGEGSLGNGPTSTIDTERITPNTKLPDLYDIKIIQGEIIHRFADTGIFLAIDRNFTISLPAWAVSNNLKSIIITLWDPSNHKKQYSFLLRINKDGSAYEAVIPAFKVEGYTKVVLEIYDYEAFIVASYQNGVTFGELDSRLSDKPVLFPDIFLSNPFFWLWLVLVLLLFVLIIFLLARRKDDDDEDNE